jgi:hypothetical protein
VGELQEMLGPGVRVRAGIDEHRRAAPAGDHYGDPGTEDAGEPPDMEERRGEHRSRVPGGDDRVGLAVANRADGACQRRIRLCPDGFGRLLVHRDQVSAGNQLEPVRVEVRPAEEDRGDRLGGGCDGAREDLAGRVVAAQGVDRDAGRH